MINSVSAANEQLKALETNGATVQNLDIPLTTGLPAPSLPALPLNLDSLRASLNPPTEEPEVVINTTSETFSLSSAEVANQHIQKLSSMIGRDISFAAQDRIHELARGVSEKRDTEVVSTGTKKPGLDEKQQDKNGIKPEVEEAQEAAQEAIKEKEAIAIEVADPEAKREKEQVAAPVKAPRERIAAEALESETAREELTEPVAYDDQAIDAIFVRERAVEVEPVAVKESLLGTPDKAAKSEKEAPKIAVAVKEDPLAEWKMPAIPEEITLETRYNKSTNAIPVEQLVNLKVPEEYLQFIEKQEPTPRTAVAISMDFNFRSVPADRVSMAAPSQSLAPGIAVAAARSPEGAVTPDWSNLDLRA